MKLREKERELRRQHILDAAEQLFEKQGVEETRWDFPYGYLHVTEKDLIGVRHHAPHPRSGLSAMVPKDPCRKRFPQLVSP